MKTTIWTILFAGLAAASPSIVARGACKVDGKSGTCMDTSQCSGTSLAGSPPHWPCPGGNNIQCCIPKKSSSSGGKCSVSGRSGTCMSTSKCKGTSLAGSPPHWPCPGGDDIQCCVAKSSGGGGSGGSGGGSSSGGKLPGLNSKQSAHARAIIGEVKKEGLGRQGCLAGIATALVESSIYVYASHAVPKSLKYPYDKIGSDHDSIGIFQQRAEYYPNIAKDMDPAGSASQFFSKMKKIKGWKTMNVGDLCQKVQVSAYPDRYEERVSDAKAICSAGGS